MSQGAFRRYVRDAAADRSIALAQLKDLAPPPDFPGEDQPKGLLVTREPAQRR